MWKFPIIAVLIALGGCQTDRIVYTPDDTTEGHGTVVPIGTLIPKETKRVRLVFVHGVGDHCPGYALPVINGENIDRKRVAPFPWLNEDVQNLIGLQRRTDMVPTGGMVNAGLFMRGEISKDELPVQYRVQHYSWNQQRVLVDAIEITWSPLTQKIKSNWLGYDAPSAFSERQTKEGCVPAADVTVPQAVRPWNRAVINGPLKETVLDRDLVDAVIYSGTFGKTIAHGVAEALCHAITSTPEISKCSWPQEVSKDEAETRYLFVTHSLGSRIIFDFFRDLAADEKTIYRPNLFDLEEHKLAFPFVSSMLERTSAIYMMANQLPMLGLARIEDASLLVNELGPLGESDRKKKTQQEIGGWAALEEIRRRLHEKSQANQPEDPKKQFPPIQITAFHDTNDLLTWPLPRWYATSSEDGAVAFTNVFVNNAPRWFGFFEHPGDAHSGYFRNRHVWCVISRGAIDGRVNPCPD